MGNRIIIDTFVREWTPLELNFGGKGGWWDASNTGSLTIVSGNRVSVWNDLSGNGNHVSQTSPINRPYSGTQTIGGLNVIEFIQSQSTSLFHIDDSSLDMDSSNGVSFFIVARHGPYVNIGSSNNNIWGKGQTASVNAGYGLLFTGSTMGAHSGVDRRVLASNAYDNSNFLLSSTNSISSPTLQEFYINGTYIGNDTTGTGNSNNTDLLYFGRDSSSVRYSNCWIGELILLAGATSASTRLKIEGYLAWKWGLQESLPSTHQYRYIKPYVTKV
jgi:hypothetical protein